MVKYNKLCNPGKQGSSGTSFNKALLGSVNNISLAVQQLARSLKVTFSNMNTLSPQLAPVANGHESKELLRFKIISSIVVYYVLRLLTYLYTTKKTCYAERSPRVQICF